MCGSAVRSAHTNVQITSIQIILVNSLIRSRKARFGLTASSKLGGEQKEREREGERNAKRNLKKAHARIHKWKQETKIKECSSIIIEMEMKLKRV